MLSFATAVFEVGIVFSALAKKRLHDQQATVASLIVSLWRGKWWDEGRKKYPGGAYSVKISLWSSVIS